VRINESPSNIVELSAIRRERHRALSPYGPVRAGLTTLLNQETVEVENEARLTELLNSLESVVETLQYKSFTAYDTLTIALEGVRVALSAGTQDTTGTDETT
jgi:hypothetical protein